MYFGASMTTVSSLSWVDPRTTVKQRPRAPNRRSGRVSRERVAAIGPQLASFIDQSNHCRLPNPNPQIPTCSLSPTHPKLFLKAAPAPPPSLFLRYWQLEGSISILSFWLIGHLSIPPSCNHNPNPKALCHHSLPAMKTWTWAALAASLVSVVSASPLAPRQQRQFTAITGPRGIVERKPFAVLQRDSDAFNLYLLALVCAFLLVFLSSSCRHGVLIRII